MNWRRGFFRLWLVGSLAWMIIVVCVAVAADHVVLKKPDITVHWGKEDIVYSATSTEEEIRADIQRRADKINADNEEQFQNMTPEQKDYCERNRNMTVDKLPKYCQAYAFHGSKVVGPNPKENDWEDQIRFPPRTVLQEVYHLAPWMLVPPAMLLLVGWVIIWIARGFAMSR